MARYWILDRMIDAGHFRITLREYIAQYLDPNSEITAGSDADEVMDGLASVWNDVGVTHEEMEAYIAELAASDTVG